MKFKVFLKPGEDDWYVVECPQLPGCISQGKTVEEALTSIKEAIQAYLESLKKHNEPIPELAEEYTVEVTT